MRGLRCGNSSVGRARPCQGRGREFESRFPLQFLDKTSAFEVLFFARQRYRRGRNSAGTWPGGRVVMQRTANPRTPVRFRPRPPCSVDAAPRPFRGNSSVGRARPCQGRGREFESRFPLQCSREPRLAGVSLLRVGRAAPRAAAAAFPASPTDPDADVRPSAAHGPGRHWRYSRRRSPAPVPRWAALRHQAGRRHGPHPRGRTARKRRWRSRRRCAASARVQPRSGWSAAWYRLHARRGPCRGRRRCARDRGRTGARRRGLNRDWQRLPAIRWPTRAHSCTRATWPSCCAVRADAGMRSCSTSTTVPKASPRRRQRLAVRAGGTARHSPRCVGGVLAVVGPFRAGVHAAPAEAIRSGGIASGALGRRGQRHRLWLARAACSPELRAPAPGRHQGRFCGTARPARAGHAVRRAVKQGAQRQPTRARPACRAYRGCEPAAELVPNWHPTDAGDLATTGTLRKIA